VPIGKTGGMRRAELLRLGAGGGVLSRPELRRQMARTHPGYGRTLTGGAAWLSDRKKNPPIARHETFLTHDSPRRA